MNKACIKYCFLFLILILQLKNVAQTNDFGIWSTLSLEKKINKKLRFSFDEELRLFENASRISCYFSDLSITYKPIKKIGFNAGYRFYINLDDPELQEYYEHRYYAGTTLKLKHNDWEINLRAQLQNTQENINRSDKGGIPKLVERTKIELLYNIYNVPIAPFISTELFYQFNFLGEEGFNKLRYCAGLEYIINTRSQINTYFMAEQRFNTYKRSANYVVGVKYAFTL